MDKIKANKRNSKKNLNGAISKYPEKEPFFFDESRFGTYSKVGHGWFKKGIRTQVKTKLGRKISISIVQLILEMERVLACLHQMSTLIA